MGEPQEYTAECVGRELAELPAEYAYRVWFEDGSASLVDATCWLQARQRGDELRTPESGRVVLAELLD